MDSPFFTPEGWGGSDEEVEGAFVNTGTHQVPLFQGLCPLKIACSPDPYGCLLSLLRRKQAVQTAGCFCLGSVYVSVGVAPQSEAGDDVDQPVLSQCGASAILRVADSSMVQCTPNHIRVHHQQVDVTSLTEVLLAEAGARRPKTRLFEYEACKYELSPSLSSALPSGWREAKRREELMHAINDLMQSDMQAYVDGLP